MIKFEKYDDALMLGKRGWTGIRDPLRECPGSERVTTIRGGAPACPKEGK